MHVESDLEKYIKSVVCSQREVEVIKSRLAWKL